MNVNNYLQAMLLVGFIAVILMLFFFTVPPANFELFKTALTAMISFISGAAIAVSAVKQTKGDTPNEKTVTAPPAAPES